MIALRAVIPLAVFLLKPVPIASAGGLAQAAIAIGFGFAISCSGALAQTKDRRIISRPSPPRSTAPRSRQYRDVQRLADHRPRLCRDAFSKLNQNQRRQRQEARADVELQPGFLARRRSNAGRGRRHHVSDRIVERGARHRRPHRQEDLSFDPKVDREKGYKGCCDVVNRGVAVYKGKVFVASYDGRLIRSMPRPAPSVEKDTLIDKEHSYTITGGRARSTARW